MDDADLRRRICWVTTGYRDNEELFSSTICFTNELPGIRFATPVMLFLTDGSPISSRE